MSKKLLFFISIVTLLFGCQENEESTFWSNITVDNEYRPFVFAFSNTTLPICADHAQPKLESIINNTIDSIEGDKINGVMMYPSLTDDHYSNIAEEIKFLYDNSGNGTLKSTPAFFSNMVCHNIDTLELLQSLVEQRKKTPGVNMGIQSTLSGDNLKVYVKGFYKKPYASSNHSLAVYAYRKSEQARQATLEGDEIYTMKNKVVSALTSSMGKSLSSASVGDELQELLTLDLSGENSTNIGILAVLYELEDGKPSAVINSIKLESN